MISKKALQAVLCRLDTLETSPHTTKLEADLVSALLKIDALRAREDVFKNQLTLFEDKIGETRQAVAEGIERVERTERRIHATLKRARAELKKRGLEDPGLEAEAVELRNLDGAGGQEQGMPAVREALATDPSSIEGLSLEQLQRIRGLI